MGRRPSGWDGRRRAAEIPPPGHPDLRDNDQRIFTWAGVDIGVMRHGWVFVVLLVVAIAPTSRADPATTMPGPTEGLAQWTFSNAANYTLSNLSLVSGGATLAWFPGVQGDKNKPDFDGAETLLNVDVAGSPGEVLLADTSGQGPPQVVVLQPDPAQLADNYLDLNTRGLNFGTSSDLFVGNWSGTEWTRGILRFPALPIPSNATLTSVRLSLYLHTADTSNPMDISVHRPQALWTELGSTWDTYDGVNPWNASGGDFDPNPEDTAAGVAATLGWYSWNITTLARGWWNGTIPNWGLLVRQADDTLSPDGKKQFSSSDTTNASARPFLTITYTTPWSYGLLESRIFDTGWVSAWGSVWWNASLPAGSAISIATRSGSVPSIDGTWSPWSAPYPASGSPNPSPSARYLQYRATLTTATAESPSLLDVSLAYVRYAAAGIAITESFRPFGLLTWGRVEADWNGPAGTQVLLSFSQDGGLSWLPVTSGQNLTSALAEPIRLRLVLSTTNTAQSPRISSVSLGFLVDAPGGSGVLPEWLPWWLFLTSLLALPVWLVLRHFFRTPFRATDVFLIHADGRLVARVGGAESPLNDELATSAMFTVVARFVRDSFADTSGARGQLKSFQVDEREVAIAKGTFLFIALLGTGARPPTLEAKMIGFLGELEAAYGPVLAAWNGFRVGLDDLDDRLHSFLDIHW